MEATTAPELIQQEARRQLEQLLADAGFPLLEIGADKASMHQFASQFSREGLLPTVEERHIEVEASLPTRGSITMAIEQGLGKALGVEGKDGVWDKYGQKFIPDAEVFYRAETEDGAHTFRVSDVLSALDRELDRYYDGNKARPWDIEEMHGNTHLHFKAKPSVSALGHTHRLFDISINGKRLGGFDKMPVQIDPDRFGVLAELTMAMQQVDQEFPDTLPFDEFIKVTTEHKYAAVGTRGGLAVAPTMLDVLTERPDLMSPLLVHEKAHVACGHTGPRRVESAKYFGDPVFQDITKVKKGMKKLQELAPEEQFEAFMAIASQVTNDPASALEGLFTELDRAEGKLLELSAQLEAHPSIKNRDAHTMLEELDSGVLDEFLAQQTLPPSAGIGRTLTVFKQLDDMQSACEGQNWHTAEPELYQRFTQFLQHPFFAAAQNLGAIEETYSCAREAQADRVAVRHGVDAFAAADLFSKLADIDRKAVAHDFDISVHELDDAVQARHDGEELPEHLQQAADKAMSIFTQNRNGHFPLPQRIRDSEADAAALPHAHYLPPEVMDLADAIAEEYHAQRKAPASAEVTLAEAIPGKAKPTSCPML